MNIVFCKIRAPSVKLRDSTATIHIAYEEADAAFEPTKDLISL